MQKLSLADLQLEFKCQKCGWCCSAGGDPIVTTEELKRIASYIGADYLDKSRMPFSHVSITDGLWRLYVTGPCFFMDKVTRECLIHDVKPQCCRDFPFVAVSTGFSPGGVLFRCPGAVRIIKDVLGVD